MQTLSLTWGIFSVLGMLLGFIPCFGSWNWFNIPFAIVGFIISLIAIINTKPHQSKSSGISGLVMCTAAIIFGLIRLALGGGFF